MIFVKNPLLGKVKTRLASVLGNEKALHIYHELLAHTHKITNKVQVDKVVFYSDEVVEDDIWTEVGFQKSTQKGASLGDRMSNAFLESFSRGYESVVIIGSDCFEINEDIITDAFCILEQSDVALGPARDGGYYLLGMRKHHKAFFENKTWSTNSVLLDTLLDLSRLELTFQLLPTLSDIDDVADLVNYPNVLEP